MAGGCELAGVARALRARDVARRALAPERRHDILDQVCAAPGCRVGDQQDARQNDQERKRDMPHCCGVDTNPRTCCVEPQRRALAGGSRPADSESDPGGSSSVFTAVEAMGLKLQPKMGPILMIAVDHVEKTPTEN